MPSTELCSGTGSQVSARRRTLLRVGKPCLPVLHAQAWQAGIAHDDRYKIFNCKRESKKAVLGTAFLLFEYLFNLVQELLYGRVRLDNVVSSTK